MSSSRVEKDLELGELASDIINTRTPATLDTDAGTGEEAGCPSQKWTILRDRPIRPNRPPLPAADRMFAFEADEGPKSRWEALGMTMFGIIVSKIPLYVFYCHIWEFAKKTLPPKDISYMFNAQVVATVVLWGTACMCVLLNFKQVAHRWMVPIPYIIFGSALTTIWFCFWTDFIFLGNLPYDSEKAQRPYFLYPWMEYIVVGLATMFALSSFAFIQMAFEVEPESEFDDFD